MLLQCTRFECTQTSYTSISHLVDNYSCAVFIEMWLQEQVSFENVYTYFLLASESKHGRTTCRITITVKNAIRKGVEIVETCGSNIVWIKFDKVFFNIPKDLYKCAVSHSSHTR